MGSRGNNTFSLPGALLAALWILSHSILARVRRRRNARFAAEIHRDQADPTKPPAGKRQSPHSIQALSHDAVRPAQITTEPPVGKRVLVTVVLFLHI